MQELITESQVQVMPNEKILDLFLSNQESPGTQRTYSSTIRAFLALSGKRITDIDQFDALGYNTYLKGFCAPATVQRQISTLNMFFAFALKLEIIKTNSFAIVKQTKVPSSVKQKFLTANELDRLLNVLAETRPKEYVLGLILASLGLRISEAVNLSHNDFITSPDGGIEVRLLRKGNKIQLLPLRDDVWQVVQAFMGHGTDASDTRPLFTNPSGNRTSDVTLRSWIERAVKKAGIKKRATPHWLRHSFATLLLDKGQTLENVCWAMGHSNVSTTSIYLHPTDKKISDHMPINVKQIKCERWS